jgi:hypothetical protein
MSDQSKLHAVEPQIPREPAKPAEIPDPFDLASLQISADYAEIGVKKLLKTVPCRKPSRQDWVRVHPSPDYRGNFCMIELKEDREEYLVGNREVGAELVGETATKTLYTACNRQGVTFLWPVRLPGPDGKDMEWHRSAREAAAEATTRWIRVAPNMSLGAYEILQAEGITAEPKWPEVSFQELIRICFRDRLITDREHPVVKRLRGLA